MVRKLRKALYGLKQASRAWYEHINTFLIHQGNLPSARHSNLYYTKHGLAFIFIALFVDDSILVSSNFTFLMGKIFLQFIFFLIVKTNVLYSWGKHLYNLFACVIVRV